MTCECNLRERRSRREVRGDEQSRSTRLTRRRMSMCVTEERPRGRPGAPGPRAAGRGAARPDAALHAPCTPGCRRRHATREKLRVVLLAISVSDSISLLAASGANPWNGPRSASLTTHADSARHSTYSIPKTDRRLQLYATTTISIGRPRCSSSSATSSSASTAQRVPSRAPAFGATPPRRRARSFAGRRRSAGQTHDPGA